MDDEKSAKNVELKKGKPGYNPYEEEEVDEYGDVSWCAVHVHVCYIYIPPWCQ